MIEVFVSAYGSIECRKDGMVVDSRMIGQYIYQNAHAVFVCAVTHRLERITITEHIIADGPVGGLVVVVPFAFHRIFLGAI